MKIQTKLFFAFLASSIILVSSMYALMQWSFDQGMLDYINERELSTQGALAESLGKRYAREGSWDFIRNNHRLWKQILTNNDRENHASENGGAAGNNNFPQRQQRPPRPDFNRPPPPRGDYPQAFNHSVPPEHLPPPDRRPTPPRPRIILLDNDKNVVFGPQNYAGKTPKIAIIAGGETVGWLTIARRENLSDAYDVGFVREQQTAFLIISGLLLLLSACIAYPLASLLTRPIKQLAQGTTQLTSGNFDIEIQHHSGDELGQLTQDFNRLAKTLSANESARRRWIADISHELRTPLTICRGELEAMIEGVRPATQENVASTHQEVLHLQRIVEDLYELSNADLGALRYQFQDLDLCLLLREQWQKHAPAIEAAGLTMELQLPQSSVMLSGDRTRLSQLINNLLNNSSKYTDSGGHIRLTLREQGGNAHITIEDSSPGVNDSDLHKLFDPLYRVENSRNRKSGGSGLGLSICQRIVAGHNGKIDASHSQDGGIKVTVQLPLDT